MHDSLLNLFYGSFLLIGLQQYCQEHKQELGHYFDEPNDKQLLQKSLFYQYQVDPKKKKKINYKLKHNNFFHFTRKQSNYFILYYQTSKACIFIHIFIYTFIFFVFSKTALTFLMKITLWGNFGLRTRSVRVLYPGKFDFLSYSFSNDSEVKLTSLTGFSSMDTQFYDVIVTGLHFCV